MQLQPLVSIIMPAFNSSLTIAESIESVLSQTYQNWELLITDDVSTDATDNIVLNYCDKDPRIKLFKLDKNVGAGGARNNSIQESNGDYVAFLDADDVWLSNKLTMQIEFMQKNQVLLSYSAYQKFNSLKDGGVITPPSSVNYHELLTSNVIGCLTAMYDARVIGKRYFPLIRKRQDMGLWLNILKDIGTAYCVPSVLAKYRTDMGMTQNKFMILKWQWKFYRDVVGLNLVSSSRCFLIYVFKGFYKYLR